MIYPLVAMLGQDPLVTFVWGAFQVVASIVGAISSALQVWSMIRPLLYGGDEEETETVEAEALNQTLRA